MNNSLDSRLMATAIAGMSVFCRSLLLCCIFSIVHQQPACAEDNVQRLINNGGYIVDDGSGLHQYRENEQFVPASTLKILTSLVALEFFGPEYRFETRIYLDSQGTLYVKGYGDPLLTSEILLKLAEKLKAMGIRQVLSICLDDSAFDLRGETASEENSAKSYDAPNGALAVNFNAVSLLVSKKGKISSGESQTPTLPLMRGIGANLPPGVHRLNINVLPAHPGKTSALRYVGELFTAQLNKTGIKVRHPWKIQATPSHLKPILIHRSPENLEGIIKECLKYSNNFIANQLFLACGVHTHGLPATWEKSRQAFSNYLATSLDLPKGSVVIMEGSGLSRQNRISSATFIKILYRFKPYASLLKLRETIPLKSGTLTGVYCYAGYFPTGETLIPFAILLNQPENTRNHLLKELHLMTVGVVGSSQ